MDKTKIAEAVKSIQVGYNTEKEEYILKAITQLRSSVSSDSYTPPQKLWDILKGPRPDFMKCGLEWLDNFMGGGIRKEELVLLAGIPHSGKTHLLSYIAGQFLINDYSVLHINGEDLLWDTANIYNTIMKDYPKELNNLYLSDMSNNRFSVYSVRDILDELKKEGFLPDIVVVDYMDILYTPRRGQDWLEAEELTRDLRFLAKEFNLVLITASQMNYESSGGGKGLSRLFRSKVGKAMNADIIITLDSLDRNLMSLNIEKGKGRYIKTKNILLYYDWVTMEMRLN